MWILSPTASLSLLDGFGARLDEDNWGAGVYFLAEARQEGQQQGMQQGMQQGIQTERRITIENLLRVRFGTLDEELVAIIEPMLVLPPEEFTRFLLQSSREELLARFRQT